MARMRTIYLTVLGLALVALSIGCSDGPIRCDPPELPDPTVILSPDSVLTGAEVTVVASFDEPLFDREAGFVLPFQDVEIVDAATDEWIGTYSDTWLDFEWLDGPIVSGVVIDGEVIDEFSIELILEFPDELIDGVIVRMSASNDDPHCYAGVYGEAPLAVDFVKQLESPVAALFFDVGGRGYSGLTHPDARQNVSRMLVEPSEPLSDDQCLLLRAVASFRGRPSWHQLGRVTLGRLSSPSAFTEVLRSLIEEGLLNEVEEPGAPLPRLELSPRGRAALRQLDQNPDQRPTIDRDPVPTLPGLDLAGSAHPLGSSTGVLQGEPK